VKLGGRLPYPEPAALKDQNQDGLIARESPGASNAEGGKRTEQAASPAPESAPDKASDGNARADTEVTPAPQIGSPSNPWCRFCPPEAAR